MTFFSFSPSAFEAPLHVQEPPVLGVWDAVLQPVRPAEEHQLPRRVPQPDAQVRAADVHGPALPGHPRAQHHSLWPKTREHPALQPQKERHQDCGFWQFVSAWAEGEFGGKKSAEILFTLVKNVGFLSHNAHPAHWKSIHDGFETIIPF